MKLVERYMYHCMPDSILFGGGGACDCRVSPGLPKKKKKGKKKIEIAQAYQKNIRVSGNPTDPWQKPPTQKSLWDFWANIDFS